jgi:hypothetical protein
VRYKVFVESRAERGSQQKFCFYAQLSAVSSAKLDKFHPLIYPTPMLTFQEFFAACAGYWKTDRIYHFMLKGEIERSYTEFQALLLNEAEKQKILEVSAPANQNFSVDSTKGGECPGFAIHFDTESEKGEKVSMSLKALFVPDAFVSVSPTEVQRSPLPLAAQVAMESEGEMIQGYYLRDEGYSEGGAIAGRFTYQPTRQTLEMTTYYNRSVAVDQMRFISDDVRMRTIVTYRRPAPDETPSIIDLIGFGVERKGQ